MVLGDHGLVHVRKLVDKSEHNFITDSDYKVNHIRTKLRISIFVLSLSLILLCVNLV